MRLTIPCCLIVAICVGASVQAQQTAASPPSARDSTHRSAAPVTLPPEPTAHVASGDSAARAARAMLYVARGEAALRAGMRDSAKVAWEKALDENAACTDASVDLARMLTEDGQGGHARALLMAALQYDPTNPKLLHFSARRIGAPPDSSQ
jgi:Tfp pilus assembly protein PilF